MQRYNNGTIGNIGLSKLADEYNSTHNQQCSYTGQNNYDNRQSGYNNAYQQPINNSFQQNNHANHNNNMQYQNNIPRCPYCGCTDLHYNIVQKTSSSSFLKVFTTIMLIITVVFITIMLVRLVVYAPFLFAVALVAISLIALQVWLIRKSREYVKNNQAGALQIYCKCCGKHLKYYKK